MTGASRSDPADTGLGRVHGGPVTLETSGGAVLAAEVLVATGRRPNTAKLGLEAFDPRPDWLHLVGDASGEPPLTHWGKYRAQLLGAAIQARAPGRPVPSPVEAPVPQVVFTDPQVASVGATLEEAQGARAIDVPFSSAAGASLLRDHLVGQARLVVDADDRLLGATFVGPDVAELVHSATVAIVGGLTPDQLWHAVPSYPTASEVWLRLLEADRNR